MYLGSHTHTHTQNQAKTVFQNNSSCTGTLNTEKQFILIDNANVKINQKFNIKSLFNKKILKRIGCVH